MSRKLRYFSADRLPGGRVSLLSLFVCEASIPFWFSSVVKTLGVTLDAALSLNQHVSAIVRSCFFHVRSLSKVRSYLTHKAANSIAVSLNLSKLDFCNSILAGFHQNKNVYRQHKMQQLELPPNVGKLITSSPFSDNFTGCLCMTASHIKLFLPHTCQFMEMLLSASLSSFISTPPRTLSDQLQDLFLMFLGQRFKDKTIWSAGLQICCSISLEVECIAWRHQGKWLQSVIQSFFEDSFL